MSRKTDDLLRLGFLIHDVSRLRRIVTDRALKPLGITRSQWWVLGYLSRRDGMTQTALAADLDLTKVAVGGLISRMEAAGFVERRADPMNSRIRRVFLSASGMEIIHSIRGHIDDLEIGIAAGLDEANLAVTMETLRTMKRTLLGSVIDDGDDLEPDNDTDPAVDAAE